jgi:hemoglobin
MADPTTMPTDYEQIGGARAVSAVVDRFYELVLADPQLAPFFADTDMGRLKRHQVLLISQVMGGPADYDGRELREAHAGRQITSTDFARVVDHLVAALHDTAVPPDVIDRVGAALGTTAPDIIEVQAR